MEHYFEMQYQKELTIALVVVAVCIIVAIVWSGISTAVREVKRKRRLKKQNSGYKCRH